MAAPRPDLSSILSSLITHPVQITQSEQIPTAEDDSEYDPSQFNPAHLPFSQPAQKTTSSPDLQALYPDIVPNAALNYGLAALKRPVSSNKPTSVDSITTYAAALRYITSTLMPKPYFVHHIRHLIETQNKHEREWLEGRQKLMKQLENRDASRQRLNEVLASVGGKTDSAHNGAGEMSKVEELKVYDRKIWRAQKEMVDAAERELEKLGVPFFGEKSNVEGESQNEERKALRKRVIELLEDLCGREEGNDAH